MMKLFGFGHKVSGSVALSIPEMRDLANALNNAAAAWEPGARNFGKIASENMLLCVDKLQQTGFSVSKL